MTHLRAQLWSSTTWTLTARIVQIPLRFITSVALVRYLSPNEYGVYLLILTLGGLLIYVVSLGIQQATNRYVPDLVQNNCYAAIGKLIGYFFVARTILVVSILFTCFLSWQWLSALCNLPVELSHFLLPLLVIIGLQRTTEVYGDYLHTALLDSRATTLHSTIRAVLFCVGVIAVGHLGIGLQGIVALLLVCELFSVLFFFGSVLSYRRRFFVRPSLTRDHSQDLPWNRILRFATFSAASMFGSMAIGFGLDNIIITHYLGVQQVAIYGFAIGLISLAHSFNPIILFKNIIYTSFVRNYASVSTAGTLEKGYEFVTKCGLFVGLPMMAGLCLVAPKAIVIIYKSDYLAALPVIYVFAIMFTVRYLGVALTAIINVLELVPYLVLLNLFGVLNILLSVLLVPHLGLLGAASATFLVEVASFAYSWFVAHKKGPVSVILVTRSNGVILFNTVAMMAVVSVLLPLAGSAVALVAVICSGGLFYFALSFLTKPFNSSETNLLNTFIGKEVWPF